MEKTTHNALWRRADGLQTVCTECSKDFILPDSYPDLRKILYTTGSVCPGQSTIENGKLTDSGNLICKVLFSDENGELHTLTYTLEYHALVPIKEEVGEAMVSTEEVLQSVSARALNPRKLAIRGKLAIYPQVFYVTDAAPEISQQIPTASLEKRSNTLTYWQVSRICERSLEASEDLVLPNDAPLQEIIFSELKMGAPSCEAVGGSIRFTGEAKLELLYRTTDGALRFAELPIPFHSSVDAQVTSDALCTVKLVPETLSCIPAEDATGEAHGVELDFSYSVCAWAAMPEACSSVTDCYSTACATVIEEGRVNTVKSLKKMQKQQRRMLTCPSEGMKKCMKAFASVHADSIEKGEGRVTTHCVAEITMLGTDEAGAPMTVTATEAFPWEIEEADDLAILLDATADPVTEAEAINLTLTLTADLLIWRTEQQSFVTKVEPTADRSPRTRSAVTLCYPQAGEDLWTIAKRYRLECAALLAANPIGEGALPKVLLIPAERKAIFSQMI